jgi:hypothetical protein
VTTAPREGREAQEHAPVVVLVSAPWAGPSRPAPTVLRELARRWGESVQTLLAEDPDEAVLDQLHVSVLPTWLRFVRADAGAEKGAFCVPELTGRGPDGQEVTLPGPWRLAHERTGALPKHEVDREFGPGA